MDAGDSEKLAMIRIFERLVYTRTKMRCGALLIATIAIASAQPNDEVRVSPHVYTPPQLKLTAQTTLVQLEVVVRDPRGQPVGGA